MSDGAVNAAQSIHGNSFCHGCRAAESVASNLAEGRLRSSKTDYARFVEIASGSLFEVSRRPG